jgi:uncharacterized protein (TIGR04255 family)
LRPKLALGADFMSTSKHKYPNPPIQEAICEVHFSVKEPLSLDRIKEMQRQWQKDYPNQKITEEKNIELQMGPDGMQIANHSLGHRLICRSSEGIRLVQLSGRFVAINQLRPYRGWEEEFRDTILARVIEVQSSLGPFPIARTGLRYINRIDVPKTPFVWDEWFNFSLPVPQMEQSALEGFQMHFERGLSDSRKLIVNCVAVPPLTPDTSSVILDLDVVWQGEPAEPTQLKDLIERVHSPHRLAFEAYITDKLRETFSNQ